MILSKQEQAILTPIILYCVFGAGILVDKLWRLCCGEAVSRVDLDKVLSKLERRGVIARAGGKVAMASRKELLDEEDFSGKILQERRKVLERIARMPFVKGVFLTNSLAFGAGHKNSDIDLIVVCDAGKLALARDLVKIYLSLAQRGLKGKAGRIAIDIWLDEKSLDISDFRLAGKDIYFDFWLATATPLFDDGIFAQFASENKVVEKFGNYKIDKSKSFKLSPSKKRVKKFLEFLFGAKLLSKFSETQMLKRLKRYEARIKNKGAILISPHRLRFNIPDKRAETQRKFDKILAKII